ncbi:MAG: cation:proton antiporter [Deltaproteobacteria bacterium]|nr:cation:proton antiporter [Deltaproteobacteria bacterium]
MDYGLIFVLGLGLLGGLIGAWLSQRARIPQVVGYIVIGILLGRSGFNLIQAADVQALEPFSIFALGIIGFLVGGELRIEMFRKYGKQFTAILLGEGLGAFALVGVSSGLITYAVIHNGPAALATGIVFGAIASATDPASTIDVLWEYRSKGILTTSVTAIVTLDDALAMTLYGLGTSAAEMLTSHSGSILHELGKIGVELLGAGLLGLVFAYALRFMIHWIRDPERGVALSIGLILLLISVSMNTGMDVILASMTLGFVLINIVPRRSESLFRVMRGFSVPIYVIFFVLVGARLGVANMPTWLWAVVGVYVVGRSVGKMAGAWFGAKVTHSERPVRRYLGLALFAQGGVAVGLSIMASARMGNIDIDGGLTLGQAIIFAITATTLIVQLAGPPLTKLAIQLAGEVGKNVTEQDVVDSFHVADVMDDQIVPVREGMTLAEAMQVVADQDYVVFPVVDKQGKFAGTLSMEGMRSVMADQSAWQWLVVADVMEPIQDKTTAKAELAEVLVDMSKLRIEQMAVVADDDEKKPVGVLYLPRVRRRIAEELLRRQQPKGQGDDSGGRHGGNRRADDRSGAAAEASGAAAPVPDSDGEPA